MLAGVSVDYYTRLEQGRERSPSPSVLNALASSLDLDPDQREHIFRLADLTPLERVAPAQAVDESLRELLSAWSHTPALILNRQLDVLAVNELAEALYSGFKQLDNLARMTFLDPFAKQFFIDWDRATTSCVANLRLALGHPSSADAVRALVADAYSQSEEFRRLWDRGDVRGKTHEAKAFRHPDVGEMVLNFNAFDVRSAPGHQLVVYQAPSGSTSLDKLRLLGSLTAPVSTSRDT